MGFALPVLCFAFLLGGWYHTAYAADGIGRFRRAWLAAAVSWGVITAGIIELLGIFGVINFNGMACAWGVACIGSLLFCLERRRRGRPHAPSPAPWPWKTLSVLAMVCSVIALEAWLSPPNNWDSLTYHLPRVMHWTQNQCVDHYATHDLRQIQMQPWAEFVILQFQVLTGSDHWANLVQWFVMVSSVMAVSLIAAQLGGSAACQGSAALLCVSLPAGILQACSTQNDYAVAFWLLCVVSAVLDIQPGGRTRFLMLGASVGLALLTKGTAYFYLASILLWGGCRCWRLQGLQLATGLSAALALAMILNAGHWTRNTSLFGSPLGPTEDYQMQTLDPRALASNAVRSWSLQLATPISSVNRHLEETVGALHDELDFDVNDPRTTWYGERFRIPPASTHEDWAVNPLHFLLILISLAGLARGNRLTTIYVLVMLGSPCCMALAMKWQPWIGRLQLPWFVLMMPLTAVNLERVLTARGTALLAWLALACALPWIFLNFTRPLLVGFDSSAARNGQLEFTSSTLWNTPRADLFFISRPNKRDPYLEACQYLRDQKVTRVGLCVAGDFGEYVLWQLLQQPDGTLVRVEPMFVGNHSRLLLPANQDDISTVLDYGGTKGQRDALQAKGFCLKWTSQSVSIWQRCETPHTNANQP